MAAVRLPVWGRRSTFSEADIQIEGLQWSRMYFGNACEAVTHWEPMNFACRPSAGTRSSPLWRNRFLQLATRRLDQADRRSGFRFNESSGVTELMAHGFLCLLARLDEPREFFECHPPQPPFGWHPRHSARNWATRSSFYWPGFLADFAAN